MDWKCLKFQRNLRRSHRDGITGIHQLPALLDRGPQPQCSMRIREFPALELLIRNFTFRSFAGRLELQLKNPNTFLEAF
jgi:hypothetical protein